MLKLIPALTLLLATTSCAHAQDVSVWLTSADHTALLQQQRQPLHFTSTPETRFPVLDIDPNTRMQKMEGFGFALTGGSAELLMRMTPPARAALLQQLFTPAGSGIGVSYLRISIGASDMNERVFTYDDLPAGQQDPTLAHFDLGPDRADVVPILKQILAIDPKLKILASPWSAPSWMKSNDNPKAGALLPAMYPVYAQYLVKYLRTMKAEGIPIAALTVQNEPLNPKNTPSMVVTSGEEGDFIAQDLGPALHKAHLKTEIILYDHNLDRPDYPLDILANPRAAKYVSGSGFHLYGGETSAMTKVHDAHPDKGLYFTEQMIIQDPGQLPFHIAHSVSRVVIGATRNWARNVLLWNLAADPHNGPHTDNGGCPVCQGAVTLDGDQVTRNLAFYTIAQISKFVRPGSIRIQSDAPSLPTLANVAFLTPDHRTVLLVANTAQEPATFSVRDKHHTFAATLAPGDVATYVWH
jgi:glucosylceramidase